MDLLNRNFNSEDLQSPPPPGQTQSSSHSSSFPVIAVSVIGISAAALLLLLYHVLVIKGCLNSRRADFLRRGEDPSVAALPRFQPRGLDEWAIGLIPTVRFSFEVSRVSNSSDCPVCLSEFRDDEKLKRLPTCNHLFHIDCIDAWLQANANCPLCRSHVPAQTGFDRLSPVSDRQEDFVVLELGEVSEEPQAGNSVVRLEEEPSASEATHWRKSSHVLLISRGEEWIDTIKKEERVLLHPIMRRSFSLDSCTDPSIIRCFQGVANPSSRAGDDSGLPALTLGQSRVQISVRTP